MIIKSSLTGYTLPQSQGRLKNTSTVSFAGNIQSSMYHCPVYTGIFEAKILPNRVVDFVDATLNFPQGQDPLEPIVDSKFMTTFRRSTVNGGVTVGDRSDFIDSVINGNVTSGNESQFYSDQQAQYYGKTEINGNIKTGTGSYFSDVTITGNVQAGSGSTFENVKITGQLEHGPNCKFINTVVNGQRVPDTESAAKK